MADQPNISVSLPAKLTPPEAGRIFGRPELIGRLAEFCVSPRKIWVSSPGGAGKTILVRAFLADDPRPLVWYQVDSGDADPANLFFYLARAAQIVGIGHPPLPLLTPEYLPNLPVFCRNFFREFYTRFPQGCILLFDDLQEGPGEKLFGTVLEAAMAGLPPDSVLFMLSRVEPFPGLARDRLNRTLAHLGWDDLRLSFEETRDFLSWSGRKEFLPPTIERAYGLTQGWLAGLLLFLENPEEGALPRDFPRERTDLLFDYFAGEIFARLPLATRDFLLACALLPTIAPVMAEDLTGRADTGEILRVLVRGNHFTFRISSAPEVYRFHPLFRQFLLARAGQDLDPEQLAANRQRAARLLLDSGQPEPAANLLIEARAWPALGELIGTQAETLLGQGRSQTLLQWLEALPEALRNDDPWLCYWHGCCLLSFNPPAAREALEQAFVLFEARDDTVGEMLSWYMAVYAVVVGWCECYRLDEWIARFDRLRERYPEFLSPRIEALMIQGIVKALSWRQPDRADLAVWAERLRQLIVSSHDSGFRIMAGSDLVFYHLVAGSFARARALVATLQTDLESEGITPLQMLVWHATRALFEWFVLDPQGCLASIRAGQAVIEESGIHLLDMRLFGQGITLGLTLGDLPLTRRFMDDLPPIPGGSSLDRSFLCHLSADLSLYEGDTAKAIAFAETAVETAAQSGTPIPMFFSMAILVLALQQNGQSRQAMEVIERGLVLSRGMPHFHSLFHILAAYISFVYDNIDEAHRHLREGFGLAAQEGYLNFHPWRDEIMALLCREAITAGIEVEYARHLAARRNLDMTPPGEVSLTPKEIEVLDWIRQGKSTWEIATILAISERTVKFHADNLRRKLDATSRSQAVAIALERGILTGK